MAESLPLPVLLGGASMLMALGFLALAIRNHRKARARSATGGLPEPPPLPGDPAMEGKGGRLRRLGGVLKPQDKEAIEELRSRVAQAGLYSRDAVDLFLTVRLTLMVGGLVLSLMLISSVSEPEVGVMMFMVIMSLSVLGPGMWLNARKRARQTDILRSLPGTVDLLVTCLEAGLGLEQALERVSGQSKFSDDLLATELRITLAEIKAGLSVEVSFRKLAARIGLEDVNTLTAVITQASSLGTNIASLLRDHAKTMRQHRMLQLEESAGKANAKLTLPLTMCLLPSVLIVLLGPAVVMFLKEM